MSEHYITNCSCGATISQCRCASPDKKVTVIQNGCDKCKAKYEPEKLKSALEDFFLKRMADRIPGGLADNKKPDDFDKDKLEEGKKVEKEHTSDDNIATEIAMDHLTEDPEYYKKLKKVEKK